MAKPKRISSSSNQIVREAARLKRKRRRYERHRFLAEGEDLLDAAVKRGIVPRQVFVLEGHEGGIKSTLAGVLTAALTPEVFSCSQPVLEKLSGLGSGSRVAAVFDFLEAPFPVKSPIDGSGKAPLLYMAGLGDPGNLGTLIRSAAALGATGVALGPDTADPYSPKALRSTMGAIFQVPLYMGIGIDEMTGWAGRTGTKIIGADPHSGKAPWDTDLSAAFVLALGSEREGIPPDLAEAVDETVRIPQVREAESINVAMAGTAILYEALRQRMGISSLPGTGFK